jgi:hypothetical protein
LGGKLGAGMEQRKDRFQGYYNALQTQLSGGLVLAVFSNLQMLLELESAERDYERVEISGNLLNTRSFTVKAGINFSFLKDLALHTSFIHDRENSTYATFSHRRNMGIAVLKYSMD